MLALLVSHRAKLWASTITHPCVCGRLGRRVLAPTLCDRYRASLHVVLALLVSHRASSTVWVATSVHRQPFVPLHLCIDSHLCRCIVQRLCVAVFMHPCITALCGCLYASLHNDFVRPLSCILCTFMNALLVSHRASSAVWVATSCGN